MEQLKGNQDRAMQLSFTRFAYRYRLYFTGKRAGETCAVVMSKSS